MGWGGVEKESCCQVGREGVVRLTGAGVVDVVRGNHIVGGE